MKKASFWVFMDDSHLDENVKKLLIHGFVMNFLRREHFTVPFKKRRSLADDLGDLEPDELMKEIKECDRDQTVRLKMLRDIIAKFGAN